MAIRLLLVLVVILSLTPAALPAIEQDAYEVDDTYDKAHKITINSDTAQQHSFHYAGDVDWVKFYAIAKETYAVKVTDVSSNADIVIAIYDADGTTELAKEDDYQAGKGEVIYWECPAEGMYYVRISSYSGSDMSGGYKLYVYKPAYSFECKVEGIVRDATTQAPIKDVVVKTDHLSTTDVTDDLGGYQIWDNEGSHTITAEHKDYETYSGKVTFLVVSPPVEASFAMTPKSSTGAVPDIKANGADWPVTMETSDALSVTVSLNAGAISGTNADWWLYATTPFGNYYYDVIGGSWSWQPGDGVTYQGAVFNLSSTGVLNMPGGLPTGGYMIYFELDDTLDGKKNGTRYSDSVQIKIKE